VVRWERAFRFFELILRVFFFYHVLIQFVKFLIGFLINKALPNPTLLNILQSSA